MIGNYDMCPDIKNSDENQYTYCYIGAPSRVGPDTDFEIKEHIIEHSTSSQMKFCELVLLRQITKLRLKLMNFLHLKNLRLAILQYTKAVDR